MNTKSALQDFLQRGGKLKDINVLFPVSNAVCKNWESGQNEPIGINLLALRIFLEMKGYEVDELLSLQPTARLLVETLIVGRISLQDIIKHCKNPYRPDVVLGCATRGDGMSSERASDLETAIKAVIGIDTLRRKMASVKLQISMSSQTSGPLNHEATADALVLAFQASAAFVEKGSTPDDRKLLREILAKRGVPIHVLDQVVTSLTSEHAFKNIKQLKERFG